MTIYIHADTTKGPWEDPGICDESGLRTRGNMGGHDEMTVKPK